MLICEQRLYPGARPTAVSGLPLQELGEPALLGVVRFGDLLIRPGPPHRNADPPAPSRAYLAAGVGAST
jgi:hypothetical protein